MKRYEVSDAKLSNEVKSLNSVNSDSDKKT
jgi:hypothetical protein